MNKRKIYIPIGVLLIALAGFLFVNGPALLRPRGFNPVITIIGDPTLEVASDKLADLFVSNYQSWKNVDSAFPDEPIQVTFIPKDAGEAVSDLVNNQADLVLLARDLRPTEKSQITNLGEYPMAIDGIAIIVNAANPILYSHWSLSTKQLQDVFSGKVTNWQQLGNYLPSEPIHVIAFPGSTALNETFKNVLLNRGNLSENTLRTDSEEKMVAAVLNDPNAIGYISYSYVYRLELTGARYPVMLGVDNILPDKNTLISGEYKLIRPINMYTAGALTPTQDRIIELLTGSRGIKTLEDYGYYQRQQQ